MTLLKELFNLKESLKDDLEDIIGMTTAKAAKYMKDINFKRQKPPGGGKDELVFTGSTAATNYNQKTVVCHVVDGIVKSARIM